MPRRVFLHQFHVISRMHSTNKCPPEPKGNILFMPDSMALGHGKVTTVPQWVCLVWQLNNGGINDAVL
jgi:hypothetical protein